VPFTPDRATKKQDFLPPQQMSGSSSNLSLGPVAFRSAGSGEIEHGAFLCRLRGGAHDWRLGYGEQKSGGVAAKVSGMNRLSTKEFARWPM
jgi:hypothetical protein